MFSNIKALTSNIISNLYFHSRALKQCGNSIRNTADSPLSGL